MIQFGSTPQSDNIAQTDPKCKQYKPFCNASSPPLSDIYFKHLVLKIRTSTQSPYCPSLKFPSPLTSLFSKILLVLPKRRFYSSKFQI